MSFASDIFATLSKSARAFLPFAQSAAVNDASANSIIQAYRAGGGVIRTQDARDIIAGLKDKQSFLQNLRTTPSTQIANHDLIKTQLASSIKNYGYTVLMRSHDANGARQINNYITVTSNSPLSKEQILATATSYTGGGGCNTAEIIDSAEITDAYKSSALGG